MQNSLCVNIESPHNCGGQIDSMVWVPCIPDYSTGTLIPLYTLNNFPYQSSNSNKQPLISRGGLKSKPWTHEEDQKLLDLIKLHGVKKWATIAKALNSSSDSKLIRKGKHCRERWHNHLNPDINKGEWSYEEDLILLKEQNKLGNKWSSIAKCLEGRTENAVKNRWNSLLKNARADMNMNCMPTQTLVNVLISQIQSLVNNRE